jgi:hypothetical protein
LEAGRRTIEAIILVVVAGADPLETAKRWALRANRKHGLPLAASDLRKRAKVALLLPCFRRYSLRRLEKEIGVSYSTIRRVKLELIRSGELPWPETGEKIPEWLPPDVGEDSRDDPWCGDEELKAATYRIVNRLDAFAPKEWEFVLDDVGDLGRDYGGPVILHRGIVRGATIVVPVIDNEVREGRPGRAGGSRRRPTTTAVEAACSRRRSGTGSKKSRRSGGSGRLGSVSWRIPIKTSRDQSGSSRSSERCRSCERTWPSSSEPADPLRNTRSRTRATCSSERPPREHSPGHWGMTAGGLGETGAADRRSALR